MPHGPLPVGLSPQDHSQLKLETLQPIGSFKLRGALNAMLSADPQLLQQGVWTASTGNMAQGVAYGAKRLGVRCRVVTPDNAPASKLAAIKALGAEIIPVPRDEWFEFVVRIGQEPHLLLRPLVETC